MDRYDPYTDKFLRDTQYGILCTNLAEVGTDCISRQAAIDAFDGVKVDEENCTEYDIGYNDGIDFAISKLSVLPLAQPEPKRGKWLDANICGELPVIVCNQCKTFYPLSFGEFHNFCPNCGADMRQREE